MGRRHELKTPQRKTRGLYGMLVPSRMCIGLAPDTKALW
jgi:hypothetical protein